MAGHLLVEIKRLRYTGCYTHLARFIAAWRHWMESEGSSRPEMLPRPLPRVPAASRLLSPLTAAALCIRQRPQRTVRKAGVVDTLKTSSSEFTSMRQLAMRFRSIQKSGAVQKLGRWCDDAARSDTCTMQRFPKTLPRDLGTVRNVLTMLWSSGQTEGQIGRLKTLKGIVRLTLASRNDAGRPDW